MEVGILPTSAPAVFVAAHQDDEVLTMGAAIRAHVAAGREVLVIVVGRGNKSVVRTRDLPRLLGYTPSETEFGASRDREFERSVIALGAYPIVPPWAVRLDEKAFAASAAVALLSDWVPEGSDLKTHTAYGEPNPDHVAVHDAVAALHTGGWTAYQPRFYAPSYRVAAVASLGVRCHREGVSTPIGREHQQAYREIDLDLGYWGIGYQSVPYSFEAQLGDPFAYRVLEPTRATGRAP